MLCVCHLLSDSVVVVIIQGGLLLVQHIILFCKQIKCDRPSADQS